MDNGKTIRNASYVQLKLSPWSNEMLRTELLFNGDWAFQDPEKLISLNATCEYDGERLIL